MKMQSFTSSQKNKIDPSAVIMYNKSRKFTHIIRKWTSRFWILRQRAISWRILCCHALILSVSLWILASSFENDHVSLAYYLYVTKKCPNAYLLATRPQMSEYWIDDFSCWRSWISSSHEVSMTILHHPSFISCQWNSFSNIL